MNSANIVTETTFVVGETGLAFVTEKGVLFARLSPSVHGGVFILLDESGNETKFQPSINTSSQTVDQKEVKFGYIKSINRQLLFVIGGWILVSAGVFVAVQLSHGLKFSVVLVALACGMLGGFVGFQRRLKEFDMDDLRLMAESPYFTVLSPLVGGLLAVLIYIIFMAGLVRGDAFPAFILDASKTPHTLVFSDLFNVHAVGVADYAKLMVWAFIVGFYEKFVFNVIGQFTSTS